MGNAMFMPNRNRRRQASPRRSTTGRRRKRSMFREAAPGPPSAREGRARVDESAGRGNAEGHVLY